jgi:hypothetical protein
MTIGPVQLLVVGFDHPNFQGRSWRSCSASAMTTWFG